MKVLFVVSSNFRNSQTGAGTQVRETQNALRRLGVEVGTIYVSFHPVRFELADGHRLIKDEVRRMAMSYDVAHLIHCSRTLARVWRAFNDIPSVGSSIFWGGFERVIMAWKTYPFGFERLKLMAHFLRSMTPIYQDFRNIDVLLPNSIAEGRCLSRFFCLKKSARIFPVPNGFIRPKYDVSSLERHPLVPREDYVVVPGIFANRKNQLGLIKACQKFEHPIVFLGGHDELNGRPNWFYRNCLHYANDKMIFLGYLSSSSREYWQVLAHARCACLASDCETPGIAMIEAAYAGARPVVTQFGGTVEYYGFDGEYFNPCFEKEIVQALCRGWCRGRLDSKEALAYQRFSWDYCASMTLQAYQAAIMRVGDNNEA